MKVYKNDCCSSAFYDGVVVVAANSPEEAHSLCMAFKNKAYKSHPKWFEEIEGLEWHGNPGVIVWNMVYTYY